MQFPQTIESDPQKVLTTVQILPWATLLALFAAPVRADTWFVGPPMPTAGRDLAAAIGRDGGIYALGGLSFAALPTVESYDSSIDTWSAVESMLIARAGLAATTDLQGGIYALGGSSSGGTILRTLEVYGPIFANWSNAPPIDVGREGLAATKGLDGKIYTLGGSAGGVAQSIVEVYESALGQWGSVAPMPTARRDLAAATVVTFGVVRIFAIGGHGLVFPLTTVEVYTPQRCGNYFVVTLFFHSSHARPYSF